jgi:hypothetical protein
MTELAIKHSSLNDNALLKLAREIAMDMRPIEEVLVSQGVSEQEWERISQNATFQSYLSRLVLEWNSAVNTAERVRLKSLAFVEESLPEFYARAHDPKETLNAKVEVLKTVARFAGVGIAADTGVTGERLSVTINLGADHQLKIEKTMQDRNTIEGDML